MTTLLQLGVYVLWLRQRHTFLYRDENRQMLKLTKNRKENNHMLSTVGRRRGREWKSLLYSKMSDGSGLCKYCQCSCGWKV